MKWVLAPEYRSLYTDIVRLPQLMEQGGGKMVYDGRNRVVRFVVNGQTLMVKRFKRANIFQKVAYTFFQESKPERAFRYGLEFLRRGIDTPKPIAYAEQTSMGLFTVGFFVSTECACTAPSLLLRDVTHYPAALAEAVSRHVLLLHSKGVLHGDLNLTNFLCTETAEGYHFSMIDTNRSHFCQVFPSDSQCLQNMVRLTHRRDLYTDLVGRYARLRHWDVDSTVSKALELLEHFEQRRFKF
jgi:tRNA A-37 threonylcarbamoyl transferase component Bud32